ncbi:metallophosphoesterase family protein [Litoreibacter janthinus]|uniref:Calcineurin-like phosphoesterase superfamily domain-containing protein n=1 Tax=Litoreibacter janthinus TaxID=670154 RepID=A0A1I6GJ27_9RHOB|nr:metallophosphoesterase family protein [Litoreibacter janthinus]SFR42067.1 Calcineurin-like phosphoesterase superfamily domain-containing protein [Litoreibacter janthinus]
MTNIRDLGELEGDLLLFGGAYSNVQAFEALIAAAQRHSIPAERCIFTGDVIAYGADALACAELLATFDCPTILGNCEQQLLDGASDCGCGFEEGTVCDLASKTWFEHAARQIGPRAAEFWGHTPDWLTFSHAGKRYVVIHGGATDVARFIWPSDVSAVFNAEFATIEAQVGSIDGIICGHSGIPFERVVAGKTWINAGVIGMPPHDGRAETRYAILSGDGVRFHSLTYDTRAARGAMEAAGLTQGYETGLVNGLWPSEDVLPQCLRR